jgi:uncharacterized repeat protein (TIGR02543 family)
LSLIISIIKKKLKMKKLKLLATLALASVIFITGCKKDEYQEKIGVCPLVVSTIPADKAINVPLNQIVSATFNEKMNPETMTQTSFTLEQGATKSAALKSATATTLVVGTVSYTALSAAFAPATPLEPFTSYTGRIKTSVKDLMNNSLQTDYVWTFTTIPQVVSSSLPIAGGTTSGTGTFNQGSSVTLTATPNAGYSFLNWTENGTIVSTNSSYQLTMAGNKALVANFTLSLVVTLSSTPAVGGTTTGAGVFTPGSSVTLTATPNSGYTFVNWTEGTNIVSTDAIYTSPLNASRTLVANFVLTTGATFTLNAIANNGTVIKNPVLAVYNSGTTVQLTATPNSGYTFVSWSGDATGSVNPLSVTMTANKNITANFILTGSGFTLNVVANNGSVLKNPDMISYTSGASVVLNATPNSGYKFTGWSGDATGSVSPLTVIMSADKNITANFVLDDTNPGSPAGINLGSAGNFAVLAGSGVSNTGVTTHIIGDVGAFPTATMNGLLAGNVDGILYTAADPIVGLAKTALTTAYNDAQSRSLNAISLPGQLGGLTLAPGLYVNSSTSGISGTGANGILTLDAGGDANAVWIFKMGSTLVTDAGTSIVLAGGAQAKNIYWSVGTSATLGTNSIFYGNILADQAITLTTGATLYGRALTRIAAVTLDSSTITKP